MRPNMTLRAQGPTVYVDANPLSDKHLTGIGRYTARICFALAARGARVRFFADDRELLPPRGSTGRRTKTWAVGAPGSGKGVASSLWPRSPMTPLGSGPAPAPASERSPSSSAFCTI